MRIKTIVELITLSAAIYHMAKDTNLMDRVNKFAEKGKEGFNNLASESQYDEEGKERELYEKLLVKAGEAKEELEAKIEELITTFYKKVNIAHSDEIRALNDKLEKSDMALALFEARLNKLEALK